MCPFIPNNGGGIFPAFFSYFILMEQYEKQVDEVLKGVGSSFRGLTQDEAARRLQTNGRNALKAGKKKSKIGLFFAQFKDLMTIILVFAAFLSGVLAFVTGDKSELADTAILLFIILLNAFVGFLQQYRADAAIEKLKQMSVCRAKVVRGGALSVIDAEELVVGDVVEIEEGDRIPADCRILTCENFRTDEAALTGESRPVKKSDCIVKKRALADRANTAYFSTFCVKGSARCVVTATGSDTEMGKIAGMLGKNKPVPSPLDKTIANLGKIISITVLSVALILFVGGLLAHRVSFLQNVMNAVAYCSVEYGWLGAEAYTPTPSSGYGVDSATIYSVKKTASIYSVDKGEIVLYSVTNCPLSHQALLQQMVALGGAPEGASLLSVEQEGGLIAWELSEEAVQWFRSVSETEGEQMLSAMAATISASWPDVEELHLVSAGEELAVSGKTAQDMLGQKLTPVRTVTTPYRE